MAISPMGFRSAAICASGAIYQSTSDTEAILHLVARSRRPQMIDRFIEALRTIEGAYSLVALTKRS